jgi:hypothetical protein
MLTIRSSQMALFGQLQLADFELATLDHIARFFPHDLALLGRDGLIAVMRDAAQRALALGVTTRGELRRFIDITLILGAEWLADPLHPFVAKVAREGLEPAPAFQRLHDEAIDHVRLVSGAEGQYAIRALLKVRRMSFAQMSGDAADGAADGADGALERLGAVWPRKLRRLPASAAARFLRLAEERAQDAGFDAPGPRRLWTTFMFVLGVGFDRDPALPWVAGALAAPDDRARALHAAGMAAIDAFTALLPSRSEA